MKARRLGAPGALASMIALAAGCAAPGVDTTDPATFRIDRVERTGSGVPYLLRGELGRISAPVPASETSLATTTAAISAGNALAADAVAMDAISAVLPEIAGALRVPAADLRPSASSRDEIGMTHVRLAQHKNGLRVVGGEVALHIGADGVVRSVTSTARDGAIDASPAISAAAAAQLAIQDTATATAAAGADLAYVISTGDHDLHLAWEIRVVSLPGALLLDDLVYVDAFTGQIVDRHPQIYPTRSRTILDGQNAEYPPVSPVQIGTESSAPAEVIARAAYDNTGTTYDCYKALFQRDSYDGLGGRLTSVVHVVFQTDPNNAVWVQGARQMAYGDGDGDFMAPLATALDVTAHELTHGVTAATANLAYQNEPGALNEAMSDIMGAVCEAWRAGTVSANTWLVGEDVFTPATTGDALRYMSDPARDASLYPPSVGGSRDYYPDRYQGTGDYGGVHLNSGIPNLAFHLLVAGGTHPRGKTTLIVPAIGMDKASRIFYRALTQGYFSSNTELAQARGITELVAQELYGAETKLAVTTAWAAVGVGAPPASDVTPPIVEIVSPADGAHVMPGFPVQITASDDKGVLRVELLLDGTSVGSLTAPPYHFTITDKLAARSYALSAVAYDAFNQASDKATVTVDIVCGAECDPAPRDEGGGCATGPRGANGALVLLLAAAFALRRRRRAPRP